MERFSATDRLVRLKITDRCSFNCTFCHKEGTTRADSESSMTRLYAESTQELPPLSDLPLNTTTTLMLQQLKTLGITDIRLTGGEPTTYPHLLELVKMLKREQFKVKMTTNGQVSPQRLSQIITSGVEVINFSIFSLDPQEFLRIQPKREVNWAFQVIERMKKGVAVAKQLGVTTLINTIAFTEQDPRRIDRILEFAQDQGVTLVLLPNLAEGKEAEKTATAYAQNHGQCLKATEYTHRSKAFRTYRTANGGQINVKYFQPYHPEIVCGGCVHKGQASCIEKYYGTRIEFRAGNPYVRLCLQTSTPKTLIPLQDFIDKDILSQL